MKSINKSPWQSNNTVCGKKSTPAMRDTAQQDWHLEMLCGLFLRSSEEELEWLEGEVASRELTSCHESTLQPHDSPPKSSGHLFDEKKKSHLQGKHGQAGKKNEKMVQHQPSTKRTRQGDQKKSLDNVLRNLLHLGQTMDSTVLSLIPETLRTVGSELAENKKNPLIGNEERNFNLFAGDKEEVETRIDAGSQAKSPRNGSLVAHRQNMPGHSSSNAPLASAAASLGRHSMADEKHPCLGCEPAILPENDMGEMNDNPLLLPSSWKRPDYARRTLPQLEQHVIDVGSKGLGMNNINISGTGKENTNRDNGSQPRTDCGPKTYELFTFLYNECSLTAMSHWAMLGHSTHNSNNSDGNSEEWEEYKNKQKKKRAAEKRSCEVTIPQSTFHMCGICGEFGHYEIECEFLRESDGASGMAMGAGEQSDPSQIKKRKAWDSSIEDMELCKKEKDQLISCLSKEVHVQRRQLHLYKRYCMEPNKEEIKGGQKEGAAVSHSLQKGITEEHQYTGKTSWCKICRSGFDDEEMLLCDGCDELFHCKCLDPPLDKIPKGDWFCSNCTSHDSDASSVVDIEGCGDFVIEQRKRSVAEESKQFSGVSLGQTQCSWTVALALLPESDPIVEDEKYLLKHLARRNTHAAEEFFLGELCWAKRFDSHLKGYEWWPAMVTNFPISKTRLSNMSRITKYTVTFFVLDNDAETRPGEILQFVPYYEDIGHKRLMRRDDYEGNFRRALMLCVSALGLKSFGQALRVARNGVQMSAVMNDEHRILLPPGWKFPAGWESADTEVIGDIPILAKEGGGGGGGGERLIPEVAPCKMQDSRSQNSPGRRKQSLEDDFPTRDAFQPSELSDDSLADQRMVAQFSIDEVMGGIVSWQSDPGGMVGAASLDVRYGLVVSLDTMSEMALVRALPILSELTSGSLDGLFHSDTNELAIQATDLGSSVWIQLRKLRFVSNRPAADKLHKFKQALESNMSHEMETYASQLEKEAQYREQFSVELD